MTPFIVVLAYRYSHVVAPGAARRPAAARRRGDGRRGEHRRRPRRQVVRAGAAPSRPSSRRAPSACSSRACARTGSARSTCRCSRSCRSSRRPRCCSSAGAWSRAATLTYGDFFFFNVLTLMLVMPLRMLGMWIGQAQRATASGERIFEIIDEPEEIARRAGRRRLPAGRGPHPLRGRLVRVRTRPAGARRRRPRGRARPDGRADRPHRLRQDDARVARAALLRRRRADA